MQLTSSTIIRLYLTVICLVINIALLPAQTKLETVTDTYDYIPGKRILFNDDFSGDTLHSLPAKWQMIPFYNTPVDTVANSRYYVQTIENENQFFMGGNANAWLKPMIGNKVALEDTFGIEFDFKKPAGSSLELNMNDKDSNGSNTGFHRIFFNETGLFEFNSLLNGEYKVLLAQYPGNYGDNKWHHLAMSYKGQEVKFYIDQYRMFYVPECYCPAPRKCSVLFRNPKTVVIKNFRITTGTGNNTINDILTNNTLTTHDINFDLRASTIKQSSIEFISQMAYWLKNNPDVALEIVGHTDNEGQEPANIKLSKERAEAVKAQLVLLGVTTSRLTTNGMGSARPLQTNKTVEGRANNRRVEFIRK